MQIQNTNQELCFEMICSHDMLSQKDVHTMLSTCKVWNAKFAFLVKEFFHQPRWNNLLSKISRNLKSPKFDAKLTELRMSERCINLKHLEVISLRKLAYISIVLDDISPLILRKNTQLAGEMKKDKFGKQIVYACGLKLIEFEKRSKLLPLNQKIDFYIFNTPLIWGKAGQIFLSYTFDPLIEQLPSEIAVKKMDEIGNLLANRDSWFKSMFKDLVLSKKFTEAKATLPLLRNEEIAKDSKVEWKVKYELEELKLSNEVSPEALMEINKNICEVVNQVERSELLSYVDDTFPGFKRLVKKMEKKAVKEKNAEIFDMMRGCLQTGDVATSIFVMDSLNNPLKDLIEEKGILSSLFDNISADRADEVVDAFNNSSLEIQKLLKERLIYGLSKIDPKGHSLCLSLINTYGHDEWNVMLSNFLRRLEYDSQEIKDILEMFEIFEDPEERLNALKDKLGL